jgi:pimeloyl-ACP methyl ester carboxylesterase
MVSDRLAFLEEFTTAFFAAGDRTDLVSEPMRRYVRDIAAFSSAKGTLDCIDAFARTDFRADLDQVTVPTFVIHGDSDGTVPFEVSGKCSHEALADAELVVVGGAPTASTSPTPPSSTLIDFLAG